MEARYKIKNKRHPSAFRFEVFEFLTVPGIEESNQKTWIGGQDFLDIDAAETYIKERSGPPVQRYFDDEGVQLVDPPSNP